MVERNRWSVLGAVSTALLVSGCYFESVEDRPTMASGGQMEGSGIEDQGDYGECRRSLSRGCFDGYLIPMNEIYVKGKRFQDANDLANRFGELLDVETADGVQLTAGVDYRIDLKTLVDNNNFAQGFQWVVTGDVVKTGKIRRNGHFNIDNLREGTYDLRIQRQIKYDVSRQVEVPGVDGEEPRTEVQSKTFCATLFADVVVDVRRHRRAVEQFSEFELYVTDNECQAGATPGTQTL